MEDFFPPENCGVFELVSYKTHDFSDLYFFCGVLCFPKCFECFDLHENAVHIFGINVAKYYSPNHSEHIGFVTARKHGFFRAFRASSILSFGFKEFCLKTDFTVDPRIGFQGQFFMFYPLLNWGEDSQFNTFSDVF